MVCSHTISFDQLMPVFLESKVSMEWPISPFKFVGGFGLDPQSQGILMAAQGVYSMFAQAILFPFVAHRFGYLRTFRLTAMSWPVLYLLVPYTVLLPKGLDMFGVCLCLLWRTTAQALTFPPNNIMLANSAPSTLVLGAINGVAGSTASLCRALGPTVTGIVHSQGLRFGISGLAWWVTGFICAIGALESLWMRDPQTFKDQQDLPDREVDRDMSMIDPLTIDAAIGTTSKSSCDATKNIRNQPKAQRTEEVEEAETGF
ncbi:MAG: hypothetical protein LQ351_001428 [Letrouitia transgressa]|nr:MAG: hypothetical protein LQ351_001428 [Letrouitia transgressa]